MIEESRIIYNRYIQEDKTKELCHKTTATTQVISILYIKEAKEKENHGKFR